MDDEQLRRISVRIEAIEFLLGELAADWVHGQNPGGERKFAEHHARNLDLKLQKRNAPQERRHAVSRLWQEVIQRYSV